MSLPGISVVVPTVAGREEHLARCVATYTEHAAGHYELELVIERDHPACGTAWQAGLGKCHGEYIHLTDDDIAPWTGWAEPAIECVRRGFIPAPQVYGPEGTPQSHPVWGVVSPDWTPVYMTALPFVSRRQMDHIAPLFTSHYFTDDFVSFRGNLAGWQTKLRTGYAFTHYWAQHKRGAGFPSESDRMRYDQALYQEAKRRVLAGEWTQPWPPDGGLNPETLAQ